MPAGGSVVKGGTGVFAGVTCIVLYGICEGIVMLSPQHARVPRKHVHGILLPPELWMSWDECLREAGIVVDDLDVLPAVPSDPEGCERRVAVAKKGHLAVGLGSGWDRACRLTLFLEDVRRNLSLARAIQNALSDRGGIPLTNDLERFDDVLAGRKPRERAETDRHPG